MADKDKEGLIVQIGNTETVNKISIETSSPIIDIQSPKHEDEFYDKYHRTTFQARMGRRLDRIARRVTDNNIRLSSNTTDMIRISVKRDERSQDLVSREVSATEILPIMLPSMKDVPLRHFIRKGDEVQVPSLYTIEQQEYFEIYAPVEVKLEPEDLLFRLIYDSSADEPYVMCLQVKEQLATIGYSSINYLKYWVTFYDEPINKKIIKILKDANIKRDLLGW